MGRSRISHLKDEARRIQKAIPEELALSVGFTKFIREYLKVNGIERNHFWKEILNKSDRWARSLESGQNRISLPLMNEALAAMVGLFPNVFDEELDVIASFFEWSFYQTEVYRWVMEVLDGEQIDSTYMRPLLDKEFADAIDDIDILYLIETHSEPLFPAKWLDKPTQISYFEIAELAVRNARISKDENTLELSAYFIMNVTAGFRATTRYPLEAKLKLLTDTLSLIQSLENCQLRSRLNHELAMLHHLLGNYRQSQGYYKKAVLFARQVKHNRQVSALLESTSLCDLGSVMIYDGQLRKGQTVLMNCLAKSQDAEILDKGGRIFATQLISALGRLCEGAHEGALRELELGEDMVPGYEALWAEWVPMFNRMKGIGLVGMGEEKAGFKAISKAKALSENLGFSNDSRQLENLILGYNSTNRTLREALLE